MTTELEVVLRRKSGSSWGLNVGRRGTSGVFVVTGVVEGGPASKARLLKGGEATPVEIRRGDDIVAIGSLGGKLDLLDASKSQAEMRMSFMGAGDAAVLRLRRKEAVASSPNGEAVAPQQQQQQQQQPQQQGGWRNWARNVGGRARRSMSVDVREMSKKAREAIVDLVSSQPTGPSVGPSEVVRVAPRFYSSAGGEQLDPEKLLESLERDLRHSDERFFQQAARLSRGRGQHAQSKFGHIDPLDDPKLWRSRVLFLHVSPSKMPEHTRTSLGPGRVVELGWDAAAGAQTPSLTLVCALGLAASAWLELDEGGRTVVVVCDAAGDRNRVGFAAAAGLRVVASTLGRRRLELSLRHDDAAHPAAPTVDAAVEAYEAWLSHTGAETQRALALDRLPPSFSRGLRHVDFAVEARRLPNSRPLALLGVSLRGLPVSDAPELVLADGRTILWTSEEKHSEVDWDGDEAFYSVGGQGCLLRGDFALVVKFGGAYGASLKADDPAAAIVRYVANTAFLSDGAIDVRFADVDVHPAYAPALAYGGSDGDFKLRLAFRYGEENLQSSFDGDFALPASTAAALDRGLRHVAKYHALQPDPLLIRGLSALRPDAAGLALQLADNNLDQAFLLTNTFPRLPDALLDPDDLAQLENKAALDADQPLPSGPFVQPSVAFSVGENNAAAPPRAADPDDHSDDDELDAKDNFAVVAKTPPPQPAPARQRVFGKKGVRKTRHESLPPPPTSGPGAAVDAPPVQIRAAHTSHVEPPSTAESSVPPMQEQRASGSAHQAPLDSVPPQQAPPVPVSGQQQPPVPVSAQQQPPAPVSGQQPPPAPVAQQPAPVSAQEPQHPAPVSSQEPQQPAPVSAQEPPQPAPASSGDGKAEAQAAALPVFAPLQEPTAAKSDKNALMAALGSKLAPPGQTTSEAAPAGEASAFEGPLKEHPLMKDWAKLLKVGMPRGAVARKMTEEGADPALLEFDLNKPPSAECLALLNKKAGPAPAPVLKRNWRQSSGSKKRQSLKPVHWEPLTKAEGTVWATTQADDVDDAEKAELKRLFAVKHAPTRKGGSNKPAPVPEACDAKRAANIAIGLKPLSEKFDSDLDRLLRAGLALDSTNLDGDNVAQLVTILPTDAELEETRRVFADPKCVPKRPAEQLFVAVARLVDQAGSLPAVRARLGLFADVLAADEAARKITEDAAAIHEAAKATTESKMLAEALQRLLSVGNALNEGTHRGGAAGFTLASLHRLSTTKSSESGVSVLDFSVRKKFDNDVESLDALGPPLKAARKVSLKDLRREVKKLGATATAVKELGGSAPFDVDAYAKSASEAAVAVDEAAREVTAAAKFFGEDVAQGDLDISAIFGPLADFVVEFVAAYKKNLEKEEAEAAAAEQIVEKKEKRQRQRSKRGINVDDILSGSASKVRTSTKSPKPPTKNSSKDSSSS